jgi:hypothetical protein
MAAEQAAAPPSLWRRALWMAAPIGLAIDRLIAAFRLQHAEDWSHYFKPPNVPFWCVILVLATALLLRPMTAGILRASLFIFAIVVWMILPTEAGSVHPDLFLEFELQRVAEDLDDLRRADQLPSNPMELRKALISGTRFYYRRGTTESVGLDIVVTPAAKQPVLRPAERPGVIHIGVETGGEGRHWISATGLDGRRFGAPAILTDSGSPIIATVRPRPQPRSSD